MRLFPVIKTSTAILALCCFAALTAQPAMAQNQPAYMGQQVNPAYRTAYNNSMNSNTGAQNSQAAINSAVANAMAKVKPAQSADSSLLNKSTSNGMTQDQLDEQLQNHDSSAYKAQQLAKKAKADGSLMSNAEKTEKPESVTEDADVPPPLESLQNVKASHGVTNDAFDVALDEKMSLDLRRDSQREAALSYGARGGLAKRSFQITERLKGFEPTFDNVFNFRALLVKAPSGLLIEPPIVRESLDATTIENDGTDAAVADQVLKINKQAKIVTAPRDWRTYLTFPYSPDIPPPPRVLWPKNHDEQLRWNEWVKQGWDAGYEQGEQIFEANLAKLVAEYTGMVRYRTLLAEGKISQPYALQEDRGVTGGKNEMRVGDRALRITGPSQFLTGAELWKPADR
ncbi:MAG: type IV secretory system conjugative DNA transfer family protein [Micavibrio sp.]|nr:type IV secretory system conjugative DNA transfer family protein [Micavibrio sp.]